MNKWMFSEPVYHMLVLNHARQAPLKGTAGEIDYVPVAKLFNPTGAGTWLISELDPETGIAFGLCDLGQPELGYISMDELEEFKGLAGIGIEQDIHWEGRMPLSHYAREGARLGYVKA
ncbi:DUF2958 domain-containing protein [uncultured Sphingomonas sp.]|uniref:DUF2958 domain-containing protein n=1 Tax=uncultured Sphingomonas sp. TaxID=158754 RepID=UPI0026242E86|nr:DUF2958 domain-containing protein [uncultured Sphingomonas sp.]